MNFYVETFSMIQNEIFRNQRHLQIFQQFKFQTLKRANFNLTIVFDKKLDVTQFVMRE